MKREEIAGNSSALWVMSHLKRCDTAAGRAALQAWGSRRTHAGGVLRVRGELPVIHSPNALSLWFHRHCTGFKVDLNKMYVA